MAGLKQRVLGTTEDVINDYLHRQQVITNYDSDAILRDYRDDDVKAVTGGGVVSIFGAKDA